MKKILLVITLIAVSFSAILFTGCDDKHKHSYGNWTVTQPAQCETTGVRQKQCECGKIITEIIPEKGHNYVGGICTDCGQ